MSTYPKSGIFKETKRKKLDGKEGLPKEDTDEGGKQKAKRGRLRGNADVEKNFLG